jgi:rhodanese-related sulfurtransferase
MKTVLLIAVPFLLVLLAAGLFLRPQEVLSNLTLESPSGAELVAAENTLLVDIRTPEEWRDTGVIEGALLVTYSDVDSFLAAIAPHREEGQKIALICRSGNRSSRAARRIAARVDAPVMDVAGGMIRIVREGYAPVSLQPVTR